MKIFSDAGPSRISVCICTYQRPEQLRKLLQSLVTQDISTPFECVVIDNDPQASARGVVEAFRETSISVKYQTEAKPGIAAARNASVALASGRWLAFVDDDEVAPSGWLRELHEASLQSTSVAVHAGVDYSWEAPPSNWVIQGGFFLSPDLPEGTRIPYAATNNLLIDRERLPTGFCIEFDDDFGLTGGSDTLLTSQLVRAGGVITWTQKARVRELVPRDRLTDSWALQRATRTGNTLGRVRLRMSRLRRLERVRLYLSSTLRILAGEAISRIGQLEGSARKIGNGRRMACRGRGLRSASLKRVVVEYDRAT